MLSEKEIEALNNGAYGVTKNGEKIKIVGESSNNTFLYARYNSDGLIDGILYYDLPHHYCRDRRDSIYNIVGLWGYKPEPFNLERALAGEPVKWSGKPDVKSWVLPCRSNPNLYIVDTDNQCLNSVNVTLYDYDGLKKNCVMWKEPE